MSTKNIISKYKEKYQ